MGSVRGSVVLRLGVGENGALCWAMASPWFEVQCSLQDMYSMLTDMHTIFPQHRKLLEHLYGARNDRCWKALCVENVGKCSPGSGRVVGAIAYNQAD
jgi:hypothetical protein